jgi:hypothetical protein
MFAYRSICVSRRGLIPVRLLRSRPLAFGFGLAALLGDLLLPKTRNDRRRGLVGALLTCAVMGASVVVPVS